MDVRPLAERMRPSKLDDVVGQTHLVGAQKIIRQIVENKEPTSLILWGPPGTGKTTLARIIAAETGAEFVEISAVTFWKEFAMAERGFTDKEVGMALTIGALGSLPLLFLSGRLLDGLGRRWGALIIFGTCAAGTACSYLPEDVAGLISPWRRVRL